MISVWFRLPFFLFLNEHPRLVPQTFSFPHKHILLLVPEAVGHVMHSLFCALQLLLDRICVVPFKSTPCVLQNSLLKCINQCHGNLFILVLVLGGKFLLSYYKFSLNYLKHFFFFWYFRKRMQIFVCKPQTMTVCHPCRLCLLLCLFMLRDHLHLVFQTCVRTLFPLRPPTKQAEGCDLQRGKSFHSWRCKNSLKTGTAESSLGVTDSDTSGLLNGPHQAANPLLSINHRSWGGLAGPWSFPRAKLRCSYKSLVAFVNINICGLPLLHLGMWETWLSVWCQFRFLFFNVVIVVHC